MREAVFPYGPVKTRRYHYLRSGPAAKLLQHIQRCALLNASMGERFGEEVTICGTR